MLCNYYMTYQISFEILQFHIFLANCLTTIGARAFISWFTAFSQCEFMNVDFQVFQEIQRLKWRLQSKKFHQHVGTTDLKWHEIRSGVESEAARKVVESRILCFVMKVYLINTAYIIGMSPYQYPHGMKSNKYASRQENYDFYEKRRTSSYTAFLYYSSGSKIETVKRY